MVTLPAVANQTMDPIKEGSPSVSEWADRLTDPTVGSWMLCSAIWLNTKLQLPSNVSKPLSLGTVVGVA